MGDAEPVIEATSTVFTYFSPTKSPYYVVGLASCAALFISCDVADYNRWLWLAVPAFVVAALTFALSSDSGNFLTKAQHEEQLRFARSTCISFAVIFLAFDGEQIATQTQKVGLFFVLNEFVCLIQISMFLLLSWALNRFDALGAKRNYVQITLLTSAFLVDTSVNLNYAATEPRPTGTHHEMTAFAVGSLWLWAMIFWACKFRNLHIVRRPEDPGQQQTNDANRAAASARPQAAGG